MGRKPSITTLVRTLREVSYITAMLKSRKNNLLIWNLCSKDSKLFFLAIFHQQRIKRSKYRNSNKDQILNDYGSLY